MHSFLLTEPLQERVPYGPMELQPGEHSIEIETDRFLPFAGVVDMPGLGREEALTVQLVPRWADVSVTSEPAGATIFAGKEAVGETPATIQLMEGKHQISLVREGFAAWDGTVAAESNIAQSLPLVKLQPANAKLQVNSIPRAGQYHGKWPLSRTVTTNSGFVTGRRLRHWLFESRLRICEASGTSGFCSQRSNYS